MRKWRFTSSVDPRNPIGVVELVGDFLDGFGCLPVFIRVIFSLDFDGWWVVGLRGVYATLADVERAIQTPPFNLIPDVYDSSLPQSIPLMSKEFMRSVETFDCRNGGRLVGEAQPS